MKPRVLGLAQALDTHAVFPDRPPSLGESFSQKFHAEWRYATLHDAMLRFKWAVSA